MVMKARVKPASMAAIGDLAGAQPPRGCARRSARWRRPPWRCRAPGRRCRAASAPSPASVIRATVSTPCTMRPTHGENAEGAVGQDRQHDGGDAADDARELAGLDRVGAERGPDRALLDDRELGRQRARSQLDGELVGGFDREAAADLAASRRGSARGSPAPRSPCRRARWRTGGRRGPW